MFLVRCAAHYPSFEQLDVHYTGETVRKEGRRIHIRQNVNPEQLLTRLSSWHPRDGIQKMEKFRLGPPESHEFGGKGGKAYSTERFPRGHKDAR